MYGGKKNFTHLQKKERKYLKYVTYLLTKNGSCTK